MSELEAFANRSMVQHTKDMRNIFSAPLTMDFAQVSKNLVDRFQSMTQAQKAELYGKIELAVKDEVKAKYRGRDGNDVSELASKLSTQIILALKGQILNGNKNLEQEEV